MVYVVLYVRIFLISLVLQKRTNELYSMSLWKEKRPFGKKIVKKCQMGNVGICVFFLKCGSELEELRL